MQVGVPSEVKADEHRVALTAAGVRELRAHEHTVLVQRGAGIGSGVTDEAYASVGAQLVDTAEEVWAGADLLLKVKEPIAEEYPRMRADQVIFTYLHLAAGRACTDALLSSGTTAIAYETVTSPDGSLPLLAPMSEVAGRMAPQAAARFLERYAGGRGVLMGGVPGVRPAQVSVLGAGVSGMNAVTIAVGMGAEVTVLDLNPARLRAADRQFGNRIRTLASSTHEIEQLLPESDVVIGAVLVPGSKAPTLVTDDMVATMRPGAVLVDIAVDQGGCFASTRATTHQDPVFTVHDALFYCVANMPGAVPVTSTAALTNVTLPYVLRLADAGWRAAVTEDAGLGSGVNVVDGQLTCRGVAEAFPDLPSTALTTVLR
ncbi:MAG: alanine dehydrogenase [Mycobacteriaceae bacterium]